MRKLNLYMDAGVREYWIVDPNRRKTVIYWLDEEQFKAVMLTIPRSLLRGI